mmetsp:Transcript_707/g.1701  ORF Transcript_707/g.1701 Transcript_707/m.1701 type:complete len:132 (+) Transcript_707:147-542(+)
MKTAVILATLLVGAQSFGIAPQTTRFNTQLKGLIPEDEMTPDQLEILRIQRKWSEVRQLSREEAEKTLDEEWLAAYNRFFEKYDDDMTRMQEIADKLGPMLEPPKVAKKSKGQKRRDAIARELARSGGAAN